MMKIDPQACTFFRLDKTDLAEVAALESRVFSLPWSEREFNLAFDQGAFSVFGLKHGSLAAYCSVYLLRPEMEILNIASSPEFLRCGLGFRLLCLVLSIGAKMGMEIARLEVRESNTAARGLYAKRGFRQIGVRKGYYPDTGEDALVLAVDLTIPFSESDPKTL